MVQPRPNSRSRRKALQAKRGLDRSGIKHKSRFLKLEALERRELLAVEVIAIRPDAGALLFEGDTLNVAPREFNLLFNGGANIDEFTISSDTVKLVRSGGDDLFGNGNDVQVALGYVGLSQPGSTDPADLQHIVMRPASSASFNATNPANAFPDDLYQIQIIGSGVTPLASLSGEVFNAGVDLQTSFRLDRARKSFRLCLNPSVAIQQRLRSPKRQTRLLSTLTTNF